MQRKWICLLLSLGLMGTAFSALAAKKPPKEVEPSMETTEKQSPASELTGALRKIDTFQAHFLQKIRDANGENVTKSQGEVVIRRP
ncbi:MAG: hypothetical protein ACHQJ6_05620, partial [Candidatus Berkiellales bacterium]